MDPFTPRTRGAGGRKRNLGLSAKEYTKVNAMQIYHTKKYSSLSPQITGTIASVRRHRHPQDEVDDDVDIGEHGSREDHLKSTRSSCICWTESLTRLLIDQNDFGSSAVGNPGGHDIRGPALRLDGPSSISSVFLD